jgi:hypothetical protein
MLKRPYVQTTLAKSEELQKNLKLNKISKKHKYIISSKKTNAIKLSSWKRSAQGR